MSLLVIVINPLNISRDNYTGIYPYSDNLMPIRLSNYGNISWVNCKLLGIRLHKDSASYSSADLENFIICGRDFISKIKGNSLYKFLGKFLGFFQGVSIF